MDGMYAQGVRSVPGSVRTGLSWRGKWAGALIVLNTVLLFVPPIPPLVKGSLWSYALKTLVVIFAALETHRMSDRIAAWWRRIAPRTRWLLGTATATALLGIALAIRAGAPERFVRFSAEVGLWETISTACYACGAVLLWSVSRNLREEARRHLVLFAGFFALLLGEETDYAGVVGGLVGRVDGVYVGSLHDLLNLAIQAGLGSGVVVGVGAAGGLVVGLLWRTGYLRVRPMAETLLSGEGLWLTAGLALLVLAGLGEAGLLGSLFSEPSAEEAMEMPGSIFLMGFALSLAARLRGRSSSGSRVDAPSREGPWPPGGDSWGWRSPQPGR